METNKTILGDCLDVMRAMPDASVDLVLGSPPYEDARTYGIGFKLRGQDWVDWMVERWREMQRVCRGLVVMVVEGKTRNFRYSATPFLLAADLHRAGFHLRKPIVYRRVGIPGSGGPDWLRNDWEPCICTARPGKLSWSDNTACGHPPKWAPGGAMSHRLSSGTRRNQWGSSVNGKSTRTRRKDGSMSDAAPRPSHLCVTNENGPEGAEYKPPAKANPGNVIHCNVGGGLMGSKLAHENEAPFPESLAEVFVRSFCPPNGIVLDPFSGSGTTAAVATKWGRRWLGIDVRESQVDLTTRRVAEAARPLAG